MAEYPYTPVEVAWKRPPIDREILKRCRKKSDLQGMWHSLGVLVILGASGTLSYWLFSTERWVLLAIALYVHGGLFAFNPQSHEFAHGTVFRTKWLNTLFKRIFGILHWTANDVLYKKSHTFHHLYTLHKQSEGEEVHPRAEMTEQILYRAVQIIDVHGLVTSIYDQIYSLIRPYLRNPRRNVWQRYIYEQCSSSERRKAYLVQASQFLFHLLFAAFALLIGKWFLIVVVSLPAFYGGAWYHMWVHDTMHVGREPESDDFRKCCRSVRVNRFTSFMFWHMEWHTEHHTFAAIPCYNLKKFHRMTKEHWDPPQTLFEAWREMNRHSEKLLAMEH